MNQKLLKSATMIARSATIKGPAGTIAHIIGDENMIGLREGLRAEGIEWDMPIEKMRKEPFYTGEPEPKTYTVILLYPDSLAATFGQDTYMTTVTATDPDQAAENARVEIIHEHKDHYGNEKGILGDDEVDGAMDDWYCIAVIAGQHDDIKTNPHSR